MLLFKEAIYQQVFPMLKKIHVTPLAAESLGVRSMCTYVETSSVRVLLDAGVSLAPNRFGFPPHPKEYSALAECRRKIAEAAEKAEVVTISHYHFDHHTPSFQDWCFNWSSQEVADQIYSEKLVLAKNYKEKINFSQRRRGWIFAKTSGKKAKKLEYVDSKTFIFGDTKVKFSDPVFHGPSNSQLGWLLMTTIECDGERLVFASDVQGPMHDVTFKKLLEEKPHLLIIGGPPTYLADFRFQQEQIESALKNLENLVRHVPMTILEHHLLRDEQWKERAKQVFRSALDAKNYVVTAAEFLGKENSLLEAKRKQLFENNPPDKEFEKWTRLPLPKRKLTKPPV
jgi:predicted metallo-beta-lactamase superfamily hydrolase